MRIGSLFSGIGGLELGLEWAGVGETVWQVEIDEFCRRVLAKHWPSADRSVTDVRRAGSATLERVDLICGGFPCQDVSSAGAGAGIKEGTRSGLWLEYARVVGELRPRFVVVENVASGARKWLPQVRGDLWVLGYRTHAFMVSAADVGAPHLRKRIFVVANFDTHWEHAFAEHAEMACASPLAGADSPRRKGQGPQTHEGWEGSSENAWGSPVSGLVPVVHGVSGGMAGRRRRERIRALGNAVVPQCAEVIGRIINRVRSPAP